MERKRLVFIINENKTKFIFVSRRKHPQNAITVENLSFERFRNFKYLGVETNS